MLLNKNLSSYSITSYIDILMKAMDPDKTFKLSLIAGEVSSFLCASNERVSWG